MVSGIEGVKCMYQGTHNSTRKVRGIEGIKHMYEGTHKPIRMVSCI
jgi:hypothetical protein